MTPVESTDARIEAFLELRQPFIVGALLVIAAALAWHLRFVQDDAFISFTYAKNLIEGHGLTWSGVRVEGYTNFLWVLWIAAGMSLGIDPVVWSSIGGIASFVLCVWIVWSVGLRIFERRSPALLAATLFIGNFSVVSYATGGLETMLQTLLLSSCFFIVLKNFDNRMPSAGMLMMLSLLAAAAILTRMDSVVILSVILGTALVRLYRRDASLKDFALLLLPVAIITGIWFAWRIGYYGKIFPNTFYAKVGADGESIANGFLFLWRFVHWYFIWPFLAVGFLIMLGKKRATSGTVGVLLSIIGLWCAYIVWVGGDFMEFRFIVPVAPFLFVGLSYAVYFQIGSVIPRLLASFIAMVVLVGASYHHARTFTTLTDDKTLDSIEMLSQFYGLYPDENWSGIGTTLGAELASTGARIATSAVGAIPFYSGLSTVDVVGLCDPHVGKPEAFAPAGNYRPGHRWKVRYDYLAREEVNLVLDQPTPVPRGLIKDPRVAQNLARWVRNCARFDTAPDSAATVVAMPLNNRSALIMWYLSPTPGIDRVIREHDWDVVTISL